MPQLDIPQTVSEVLDEGATFQPAALAAVKALARSKPWRGTQQERLDKLNACAVALAEAYNLPRWLIQLGESPAVDLESRTITMNRLSVLTFLNFMAMTRGHNPRGAFRWSINIFRRCFPRSFSACRQVGPCLVRAEEI